MTATTTPRATVATPGGGGAVTGTGHLIRFILFRDRVRIPAWVLGLTLATMLTAGNLTALYPTAAERQTIAETMESPATVAMIGVNHGADDYTFGAMMGHQMLWVTTILVGLMSVLLFVRHTRTEEATGRAELVRAGVVGRHAAIAAAFAVVVITNLALAVLLAVSLGASGIEGVTWGGSWLYGAAHAAVGLVFAGVAAVTAQVTEHSRGASGMAIAVIGVAYALRASGDAGDGTLSWLSPIGWAQATQVYVTDRWWPLLLAVVVAAVLVMTAVALSARRDVGAGLRAPRPGPAGASNALANPFGFALRLHRASLIAWAAGVFLLGVSYGSVLGDAEQMLTDVEAMADLLPEIAGVSVTETFAAMITTITAIIASVYGVLATLRMRSEEAAGRAEPVLATALSRTRWAASHIVVAMVGGAGVLLAGGLGLGLAGAATTGDATLAPKLIGASLAYVPALWVTIGVAAVLFGILSRAIVLTWIVVLYAFVVDYLGGLLRFPDWMNGLSPFGHVARVPAEELAVLPLVVLVAIAVGLVAAGLAAFRHRDLQSPT